MMWRVLLSGEVWVIITCPKCETQYQYEVARFGNATTKRLKCPKCSEVFEAKNPSPEIADATNIAAKAAPPPVGTDTDRVRLEPEAPELPELAPLAKDVRYSLAVIAGAQAGSVFTIPKPRIYLGRGTNMDIQLKDAEISRRHSMLEIRSEEVTLVDLGATNGTFVSGERVQRVEISNQSEFTLGSTTLMLIITHDREVAM
jgi:predicted Zn finger-like uncharacterized protein